MKSVSIKLFNGSVECSSYCELLAACGTHRKDSRYIRTFDSPEDMARRLLPMYATDEELIEALNNNIKSIRTGTYSIVYRPRQTFKSIAAGKSDEVLKVLNQALIEYRNSHADELQEMDDAVVNDINFLVTSAPKKLKSFVNSINRATK